MATRPTVLPNAPVFSIYLFLLYTCIDMLICKTFSIVAAATVMPLNYHSYMRLFINSYALYEPLQLCFVWALCMSSYHGIKGSYKT